MVNAKSIGIATTVLLATMAVAKPPAITSIETGHTVSKVRTAKKAGSTYIVASDYNGMVMAIAPNGSIGWTNRLSGFMNRDLWCADIIGDASDEILAANADGSIYCLDSAGSLIWKFKPSDAPMNSVCVVHRDGNSFVACGGYDMNLHYLSGDGSLLKTIDSASYSQEKPWGKNYKQLPPDNKHIANFIRPIRKKNGQELLAVHGAIWSNNGAGHLYLFDPLGDEPRETIKASGGVGEMAVADVDGDGNEEILAGSSSMIQDAHVSVIDINGKQERFEIEKLRRKVDGFGYRVVQPRIVQDGKDAKLFVLFGSRILMLPPGLDADPKKVEVLAGRYSYNDLWKPADGNLIVLASAQSGGSCVHIINLNDPGWKAEYTNLQPPGNITGILEKTAEARAQLQTFTKPVWEKKVPPVWFMSENRNGSAAPYIEAIEKKYGSPLFLNGGFFPRVENVDRSKFHPGYRDKRDKRKNYVLSSEEMYEQIAPLTEEGPGIAYWGGHGNDPYQIGLGTQERIFDAAASAGKKVVTIYPELEQHDDAFAWVVENHFLPMANHAKGKDVNIFIRTKQLFWNSIAYLPLWNILLSGEYADVFVPALEETTSKTMEISLASRMGLWAAGSANQWGARCARDNTSYDRLREFSHQTLPNHFLRQMIYNISCGATYLDNFGVDQNYMSILWELIAKGALYVPARNELVSLSPVHLGMLEPDERFLDTGNNAKWLTFFNQQEENANPMVFGRLNGSWPGAPVTAWDYSRYAANVTDRRLHFLPPFENGMVLIAPPQTGTFADANAPRGKLADHLHPMYRNIMKEYLTDGRNYYSPDGTQVFSANEHYKAIEADIAAGANHLPLTVGGDVAWVCAQTAPTHLRLTLVDSGYINPSAKTAVAAFHAVKPKKMTDLLSGESFDLSAPSSVKIGIDCGMFRFIDIELEPEFK